MFCCSYSAENLLDYISPMYYLVALVPLILALSTSGPGVVVMANSITSGGGSSSIGGGSVINNNNFNTAGNQYLVYRVHQLDMPHGSFGTKSSIFNLEAITPQHISNTVVRKCALFRLQDLLNHNYDVFDRILSQNLVSGVLIIYTDLLRANLTQHEIRMLQQIETRLLSNLTTLPIYLIEENDEIVRLYEKSAYFAETNHHQDHPHRRQQQQQQQQQRRPSLYELFEQNIFFDTHQFVITGPQASPIEDAIITSLEAKLIGAGLEEQLPTYTIVAHYDSYAAVPSLAFGADSNASGLVILLELMRLFSKLFASNKTKPKANLAFLVSGGGKLNYFGTDKWLDRNVDTNFAPTTDLFENMQFAICLDSLADSLANNALYMHVAKQPKPGSSAAVFWENLQKLIAQQYPSVKTDLVLKKINTVDHFNTWEHERFNVRRIYGFTLSSLATPRTAMRRSMLDLYKESYIDTLESNANIIGETLARQLYGTVEDNLLKSELAISRTFIKSLFEHFTTTPRTQQLLLTTKNGATTYQLPTLLTNIEEIMRKYSNNHVQAFHSRISHTTPEVIFYNPTSAKMSIFNVKPAILDVIITIAILLYLTIFYFIVKNFHYLSFLTLRTSSSSSRETFENNKMKTR